jgi:uncharacterized protein (TIGR04255 family)
VTDRPVDLPNFTNPPIDEVAVSVQFPTINGLIQPHFGLLWSKLRDKYPRVEAQPRIEGPIENLYEEPLQQVQFQMLQPQGRTWYLSEDDERLVQLQDTRFVQNWRRRHGDYVRFEGVKNDFWTSFELFREMLSDEKLPLPVTQQLELTYINWIPQTPAPDAVRMTEAAEVNVRGLRPLPESLDWSGRYVVEEDDHPVARLYVQYFHVLRASPPNPGPGAQFALTFRAPAVEGMSDERIDKLMDVGREVIVRTFTDLTTPAAHAAWGRTQ